MEPHIGLMDAAYLSVALVFILNFLEGMLEPEALMATCVKTFIQDI